MLHLETTVDGAPVEAHVRTRPESPEQRSTASPPLSGNCQDDSVRQPLQWVLQVVGLPEVSDDLAARPELLGDEGLQRDPLGAVLPGHLDSGEAMLLVEVLVEERGPGR